MRDEYLLYCLEKAICVGVEGNGVIGRGGEEYIIF
jgi:hypothetical protein